MKDPCKICIVQPMCNAGCDDIWRYRTHLLKRNKKYHKVGNLCITFSAIEALIWAILLFSDIIVPIDGLTMKYVYKDVAFSKLWHLIPYLITIGIGVSFMVSVYITKKKISKIENGNCGSYIWNRVMTEESEKIRHSFKGGDVTV